VADKLAAGEIKTEISCRTFRATGITASLKNGGKREIAQQMTAHESVPCRIHGFESLNP
jgi:integrase/recombinase XerD